MNTCKKNNSAIWIIYSIALHSVALLLILLTLCETPLLQPKLTESHEAVIILQDEPHLPKNNQKKVIQTNQTIPKSTIKDSTENSKDKALDQPEKKEDVFTVPIPVMYYGNSLDQNRTPGMPAQKQSTSTEKIITQPYELALIGALPGSTTQSDYAAQTEKNSSQAQNNTSLAPTSETEKNNSFKDNLSSPSTNTDTVTKKKHIPLRKQNAVSENITLGQNKTSFNSPTVASWSDPSLAIPPSDDVLNELSNMSTPTKNVGELLKTKAVQEQTLTLADLFKNTPTRSLALESDSKNLATYDPRGDSSLIGDGYGTDMVIKEGDMRYYSVWKKFLHHINETAQYNQIRHKQSSLAWRQQRLIPNPCSMAVTIAKNGTCLAVAVIHSSGFAPFDNFSVQTAWSASPYPPLPESMAKEQARFEIICR